MRPKVTNTILAASTRTEAITEVGPGRIGPLSRERADTSYYTPHANPSRLHDEHALPDAPEDTPRRVGQEPGGRTLLDAASSPPDADTYMRSLHRMLGTFRTLCNFDLLNSEQTHRKATLGVCSSWRVAAVTKSSSTVAGSVLPAGRSGVRPSITRVLRSTRTQPKLPPTTW